MTETHDDADKTSSSRRKRRGTGPISTEEQRLLETFRGPGRRPPRTSAEPAPATPKFGRYERPDFERVESMLASFANRRLGPLVNAVAQGFYGAATAEERENPGIRTAFYSFFLYTYRDPKGIRVIDLFADSGLPVEGRQKAALDACLQARLVVMSIDDVHVGKHRMRGRDLLRDEPVTALDRNASQLVKPGERLMCWQIPWAPRGSRLATPSRSSSARPSPSTARSRPCATTSARSAARCPSSTPRTSGGSVHCVANM